MDSCESNSPSKAYPKNTLIGKKTIKNKVNNINQFINNPLISHINKDSSFVFDQNDYLKYFKSLTNKNCLKCNQNEITLLKNLCLKNRTFIESKKALDVIYIEKDLFQKIKSYF